VRVRPTGRRRCTSCGHSWSGRASRYCGWCGAALGAGSTDGRDRSAVSPWIPVAAVVVVLVGIAIAVVSRDLTSALASRPDPVVDLPEAEEVDDTPPGLTRDEARAALAPFHPDRLRCEPVGCERWRFDAPHGGLTTARFGDVLAVHLDGHLVGIDPASGDQRWSVPLGAPGSDAPAPRGVRGQVLLAADDDHLAVGRDGGQLRLVDASGRHRWATTLPDGGRIWQVHPVGEVVVTAGPVWRHESQRAGDLLHAFDVADGALRWSRAVDGIAGPLGDLVVHDVDEGLVRLDPRTGTSDLRLGDHGWVQRLGSVYLVDGDPDGARLVDARTGDTVHRLPSSPVATHVRDGWLYLATGPGGEGRDTPLEVLAVDPDGALRWRRSLPRDGGGAGTLAPGRSQDVHLTAVDGALLVHLEVGARPMALDLEDGEDVRFPVLDEVPVDARWFGSVAVVHHADHLELFDQDGNRVRVPTSEAWLLSADPPVVSGVRGLLGVDLAPPG
jgi:outer membrane protein assembly factor BamB